MCRLRNEEAQLAKAKRIGGGDIGKPGRAAGTRGSAAAGGRLDPAKPRRSTNDAPSISALSISAASTSGSASRSALAHRLVYVYVSKSSAAAGVRLETIQPLCSTNGGPSISALSISAASTSSSASRSASAEKLADILVTGWCS